MKLNLFYFWHQGLPPTSDPRRQPPDRPSFGPQGRVLRGISLPPWGRTWARTSPWPSRRTTSLYRLPSSRHQGDDNQIIFKFKLNIIIFRVHQRNNFKTIIIQLTFKMETITGKHFIGKPLILSIKVQLPRHLFSIFHSSVHLKNVNSSPLFS